MVRAWVKDHDTVTDEKLPHQKFPEEFITLKELYNICGVEFLKFDPLTFKEDEELKKLRELRGFSFEDEIYLLESLSDYDNQIKHFFTEHIHIAEEVRLILGGSGYFDVRDPSDQWIRIEIVTGDMIIIPPGMYHRFTMDTKEYIKAQRYYVGKPCWSQYERPADDLESRKMYLQRIEKGFSSTSVGI
ncbi:unnamed protein product [Diamesa hyperborea]